MPTIKRTLQILEFIKRYQQSNSESPTISEIGKHFDMSSTGTVHAHLATLQREGLIERKRYSREIRIVEKDKAA